MHTFKRKTSLRVLSGFILASGTLLAGCNTDSLVTVSDITTLSPGDVDNAASANGLLQGSLVQLQGGYSGFGDDAFVSTSALISDEFYWGDTFTTRQAIDIRQLQPTVLGNASDGAFIRLQQARLNARRAYAAITKFPLSTGSAASDVANKAQARTYEGYTFVALSEGWCNSVPFSTIPDSGVIDPSQIKGGAGITTLQMNDSAVARFNEALALSSTSSLAKIGKARALLNQGNFAAAAAAVSGVSDTYVFLFQHSINSGGENNPVASLTQNGRYGVSNLEGAVTAAGGAIRPDNNTFVTALGGNGPTAAGLNYRTAMDPRIPYEARPNCFSSSIRCWLNDNYPKLDAQLPLASGVEARLIEAEAALQAGTPVLMLSKLNALRAAQNTLLARLYPQQKQVFTTQLAPLADPADPAASAATQFASRRDLLFRERAFWLYNTGHRQGDLRRLIRNYGVPSNQAFPSGAYFRGGVYGPDVAFPVPFNEANNANFDPKSCSTTTA